MSGLRGSLLRYRIMAYITGTVLAVMTIWWIVGYGFLDYGNPDVKPGLFVTAWTVHGWLYFIYLIVGIDLCFRVRYSVLKTMGILIAGTIPFVTFVAEYLVNRDLRARFPEKVTA